VWTRSGRGRELDDQAFHVVNGAHSPALDAGFGAITELGSIFAPAAAGAVIAATGRPRAAGAAVSAAGVTWVVGQAMKKVYDRPRPYDMHPETARRVIGKPSGTSWPSSHPAVLLAFLTVAGRALHLPKPARALLIGLTAKVAISRTYLGVHYPSDIVSGALIGRAIGLLWPLASPKDERGPKPSSPAPD